MQPLLIGDPATRAAVAPFIKLPHDLAASLANDNDIEVLRGLARNPNLPSAVCEHLAERDDVWVWAHLVGNDATPGPVRIRLYRQLAERSGSDASFPRHVLRLPALLEWAHNLPLETALAYLASPFAPIREQLAGRRDLPASVVAELHRDPDPNVRNEVAYRPDAPPEMLEELVRTAPHWFGRLRGRPNFPKEALIRFAAEAEPMLREMACENPQLPAEIVARLVRDPDQSVRRKAARHPNLPAGEALGLLGDEDLELVQAAAACPALPAEAIEHIQHYAERFGDYE